MFPHVIKLIICGRYPHAILESTHAPNHATHFEIQRWLTARCQWDDLTGQTSNTTTISQHVISCKKILRIAKFLITSSAEGKLHTQCCINFQAKTKKIDQHIRGLTSHFLFFKCNRKLVVVAEQTESWQLTRNFAFQENVRLLCYFRWHSTTSVHTTAKDRMHL